MALEKGHGSDAFSITAPQLARLLSQSRDDDAGNGMRPSPLELLRGRRGLERALRVELSRGVDTASVAQRRAWFGRNHVEPPTRRSRARIALRVVFKGEAPTVLLFLLTIQLVNNAFVQGGSWGESACVAALAVGLTAIKFRVAAQNELRARQVFEAQDDDGVRVWRDGVKARVVRGDLVVGDLVQLQVGDIVPADGVLVDVEEPVAIDESAMTGESALATKSELVAGNDAIVWAGTAIQRGRGRMVVLCVGEHTMEGMVLNLVNGRRLATEGGEMNTDCEVYAKLQSPSAPGKVYVATRQGSLEAFAKKHRAMQIERGIETKNATSVKPPFFEQIESLENKVFGLAIVAAIVVLITLVARASKEDFRESGSSVIQGSLVMAATIVVLASAENIELVWARALAVASRELKADGVLLQQSLATVTAGSVSVLCTDKTGTLTTSQMRVHGVWMAPDGDDQQLDHTGARCDSARVKSLKLLARQILRSSLSGPVADPKSADFTERALFEFAHAQLQPSLNVGLTNKVRVLPFTNDRKRRTVVVMDPAAEGYLDVMTLGAPDVVLPLCSSIRVTDDCMKPLDGTDRDAIFSKVVDHWAKQGSRVLCFASRQLPIPSGENGDWVRVIPDEAIETELTCLAVVALEDPVRPEAPQAVKTLQDAGISVCMVTGDHLSTAISVARECGILRDDMVCEDGLTAMDAGMFRELVMDADGNIKQAEFDRVWPQLRVLARATPADKFLFVDALKATTLRGRECVAVTGNGTNDAAALQHSDLGVALGASGTDVCKRASKIVLLDDNVLSLARIVAWGRMVQAVVHEALMHQLIVITVVLTVSLGACLLGIYSPLDATQVVWTKLCMDVLASFGLNAASRVKVRNEAMTRPPLRIDAPVVTLRSWLYVAAHATHQLVVLLVLFFLGHALFGVPSGQARLARRQAEAPPVHNATRALGVHGLETASASNSHAQQYAQAPSSVHFTLVFNTFLWMHLLLLLRRRLVQRGASRSFLVAWLALGAAQVAIVQLSGNGFNCAPLSLVQWIASFAIAASSPALDALIRRRHGDSGLL